ncbi:hypothetical protein KCU83_g391, partial [Aureobasidium melanogenum]
MPGIYHGDHSRALEWHDKETVNSLSIALSPGDGGPGVMRQLYVGLIIGRSRVRFSSATHQSYDAPIEIKSVNWWVSPLEQALP